jgi:hypothetical protein
MGKYKKFERKKEVLYPYIVKVINTREDVINHERLRKTINDWDFESYRKTFKILKGEEPCQ